MLCRYVGTTTIPSGVDCGVCIILKQEEVIDMANKYIILTRTEQIQKIFNIIQLKLTQVPSCDCIYNDIIHSVIFWCCGQLNQEAPVLPRKIFFSGD